MLDIDKELAICEAATPGPWTPMIESDRGYTDDEPSEFVRWFWPTFKEAPRTDFIGDQEEPAKQAERDGKFLSAARTGYPEALRRLKRLRELYVSRNTPGGERQAWRECVTTGELVALRNKQDAEIRELLNL